jgi:CRP/FNR family transcriptional regulator
MARGSLKRLTLPPGTGIFAEGDAGDAMYLVESGRVRIFEGAAGDTTTLKEFGLGEFFGEMALVDEMPRSASAETLEETVLLVITKENFDSMVLQNPSMALLLIQALSERIRTLTAEIERLRSAA